MCNDKRLAEEVVRLEGLVRLVELCKNESARVGSDGVLVACLAAVRKIAAAVGPEKFKNLDATELVEPRLLDSFLIFSSRNESFVWLIDYFLFLVFHFLERKWEISYYCSSNTIHFQCFDNLSSSCANYISYNVSVLILWQLPPDDWKYTNFWHYFIIGLHSNLDLFLQVDMMELRDFQTSWLRIYF